MAQRMVLRETSPLGHAATLGGGVPAGGLAPSSSSLARTNPAGASLGAATWAPSALHGLTEALPESSPADLDLEASAALPRSDLLPTASSAPIEPEPTLVAAL